ncbi:hypothetical protein G6M26_25695 [Agrobacterium tumefaciens]|nr:hypothetical protein [Agrobacterium tumefaciens]NTE21943.1 hypothetical protein [Agrobacterium tumefaciens]
MRTLNTIIPNRNQISSILQFISFAAVTLFAWQFLPLFLKNINPTIGLLDEGIWQLLLFSIITFLVLLCCCVFLFGVFWRWLNLPGIGRMVLQFKNLQLWEQFAFYWASFALLFVGSLCCLIAVF